MNYNRAMGFWWGTLSGITVTQSYFLTPWFLAITVICIGACWYFSND